MDKAEALTIEQLMTQIAAATAAAAKAIEGCTPEQWQTQIPEEDRTVGVVCHHIAYAYPFVVDWARQLARGEGAPAVTYDDVHALNHQHAVTQANVDPTSTLALLHANAQAAQEQLGQLEDADLQVSAAFPLIGGQPISVQQMVQWFLINHTHNHIEAISKALAPVF